MFRRSRLSVRPKLSTIGRTGASQGTPPSNEDSAKANIEAETPVSATDTKLADEPIKQTPGDSNEQHGETAAASAIQRRKRFSVKPKVLPGRPSALPRTPKSPIKPTLPPVKSPAPVIDKADAAIEENSTAPQQEILPSEDSRLPTTNDVLPLEGSGKNVHKPDETVNIQPCNKGKEISPKTASVPRSIPDREAIEISEKAKTLMSKANLAASSQQFSLSQLLNDKSDLVRLEKARKLRQLLKQEMLKGKTKKAKSNVKEHCLDPSKMTMRDLIRYLPTANPMSTSLESQQENETVLPPSPAREASPERAQEAEVQPKKFSPSLPEPMDDASAAGEEQQQQEEEAEEEAEEEEDGEDEDAVMVPQVKVAEDGSLIIDEESLTVEVQRMKGPNTIQDRDPIFERGSTTTYSSFRKGTHTKPWSTEETDMFFLAINMVGTDFSMICQLFPHRARTEIKNKFKKEERHNAWRIDKAFRERRRLDLEYFKKLLQKIIEYQESKKKLKAISEKEKAPRKRKRKSGKKETISLSDVEEEAEDISNEEQEGEKENLCNKTTSDSRSKRKRKDKDDPSPDSKAEKKKRKNMPDDEAIPAEIQQEDVETPESDKSTEATLLGHKARKAPKSKAILSDKGESKSDETVEAQIIVHSPKTRERLSDNDSDQEVTVLNSKPTRSGRISKPVQSLNYPAKEDRHSSASDGTLTSPGRDAASKRKSKTQGKRRTAQKQATKESKKPTLITLRASQSEESDDDEEEAHAPHWDEENSKDAFVPASLCSPKPVVGDVEETMEELLPHDMPDVLGMSTNALFPDELEPNESGSLEPCEHQLDLLVDVIDFLSEHTEASEDEAAQTLLAIGNLSNVPQLTDRQASELDHTSNIESSISIDVDDTSISFQLEEYNESLQPSTVEISQTAEFPAPHTSNKSEEESCSTQEKSPPPKKGRFAKIKPKPNLGSRATKTVCVKETKPVKLETTATSQPNTSEPLESRQDEPEPSQTENRPTNNTPSLMPSPQTGYEPCEVKETTVPPIQKVTPETTMPPIQRVTPETTMPPIQKVTPETTMPAKQTVTPETTMPPIQKVTAETTMPSIQTVIAETTMPPIQKVTPETTMPAKQTVTPETTMPPIQKVTAETTMPSIQTVIAETTMPPIQKVTPETTMPAKQTVTPETTMPPIQKVTAETTMPSIQTVTAETTMPPIQKVTPETTMPAKQTVTPETTMPPIQKITAETTMPSIQTVTAETTMPPIQRVTAETTVPPIQTVIAETTMPPIQKVTAETTMPSIQTVTAETTMPSIQTVTAETTMPSIQTVTAETTMPPIQRVTAETTVPPIQRVTAETTMPPIQRVTAETTVPPIQRVTAETTMPPIQKATPETTMPPIQKVTSQTTMSRMQTLMPETTMPPKQKVTLETTSSPKQKATLETTLSPKQKVTLETTLSPKEKVIPDTAMPPKQTVTPETTLSPIQKVTPQTTMSHIQTVTPETTMPPKQKVTLETTSSTKQKVTPGTAMPPKEKVTPETPLSPKQKVIPETTLSPKQTVTPETTLSPKGKVTPETSLSPEQKVTPETSLSPKQTETAKSSTEPSLVCDLGTSKQTVEAVCDDITTTIPSLKSQEESTSPVLEQSINKNEAVRLTNEIPEVKSSEIKPSDDTCSLQETTAAPELAIQSSKTSALPRKGRLPKIKPKPNIGRSSRKKSAVDPEEKINLKCATAVTSEAQPAPVSVSESVLVSRKDSKKQTDPGSNSGSETDLGHVKEKCAVTPSAQCVETQQEPVKAVGETMKAPELGNKNLTQTDRSSEEEKTDKPAPQSKPDSESSKLGAVQRRRWIPKVKPKLVSLPRTTKSKVGAQDNSLPIGELVEPTSTTSHSASSKPDTETGIKDAVEAQQASCSLNSTTTDLISPALPESISTPEELKSFSVNFQMVDKITEACGSNQTSVESCQLVQRSPSDSVNVHQAEGNTYENQGISQSRDSEPPEPQNTEAAAASKTFDYQHVFADMLPDQVPSDPDEPFFILSLTEIPFCPSGGAMEAQQRNPVEPVLPPATGVNVSLSDIYIPTPEKAALGSDLIRVEEYLPSAPFVDISILEEPQANPSRRTLILAEAEDNSKDNIAEASLTESHPPVKGLSETKLTGKAAAKEVNECSDNAKDVPETTAHEESPSLTSETKRKPSETKGRKRQTRNTKATRELQKEHSETQSSKTMTSSSIKDQLTCFSSESSDLIELEEGPTNVSESFFSNVFTTVDEANPRSTTKDSAGPEKSQSKPVETKATRKKQRKVDSSIESSTGRKDSLTEDSTALASSNLQENQTSLPKRAIGSSKKDNAPGKRTGKSKSSIEVASSRFQRTRVSVKSTDALSLDPLPSSSSTVAMPTQESNQQSSKCSSSEPQVSQQSDSFDGSLSEEAPTNVTQFFIGDIFTEVTNDDGPAAELEAQAAETMKTERFKPANEIAKASDDSLSGHSSSLTEAEATAAIGAAEAEVGAAIGAAAEAAVGAAPSVECLTSLIQKAPDPSKSKAKKTRGKGSKKTNKSTSSEAQPQDHPLTLCGAPKISGSKNASSVSTLSDKEPTPVSQPLAGASLTEVEKTQAQTTQGKSRQKRKTRASSGLPSLEPSVSTEEQPSQQTEPQSESKGTRGKQRNKKPTVGTTARRSRPQSKSMAELAPPQTSTSGEPLLPIPDQSNANEGFDDEPISVSQYFLTDVFTEVDDKL
ncbi:unnamed protein product [Knipowitschia caucasica]